MLFAPTNSSDVAIRSKFREKSWTIGSEEFTLELVSPTASTTVSFPASIHYERREYPTSTFAVHPEGHNTGIVSPEGMDTSSILSIPPHASWLKRSGNYSYSPASPKLSVVAVRGFTELTVQNSASGTTGSPGSHAWDVSSKSDLTLYLNRNESPFSDTPLPPYTRSGERDTLVATTTATTTTRSAGLE
ncbi:hypothetical protein K488DRAFT_85484 [Vararia minispora EC-137]|uniref:Uncharacterized protein n=1 Tax=Vararia minispora EC-137 TaxID=1314806 RepID=A0ACB8QMI0_9AGAM|nr:hypothetical protein K488DRAFT_85484 [Vararia minispora EC-137]